MSTDVARKRVLVGTLLNFLPIIFLVWYLALPWWAAPLGCGVLALFGGFWYATHQKMTQSVGETDTQKYLLLFAVFAGALLLTGLGAYLFL